MACRAEVADAAAKTAEGADRTEGNATEAAETAEEASCVGDRKKAAAAENEGTGAGIESPTDEIARGWDSAITETTPGATGEPLRTA